jgi:dihydroorotase (multifunctional complex type)
MSSAFDLGLEGGVLVTSRGRRRANVYVRDGTIAAITPDRQRAREVVSASDLLVMPGMVDAHVHLMDPGAVEREDFPTGSAAAARAGVTSIVEHSHIAPVRTAPQLKEKIEYVEDRARVDFALAAHAWPGDVDSVGHLWRAGAAFIKAFTCRTHGIPAHGASELYQLFVRAAEVDAICLVHCEDESLTADAERGLRLAGRSDGAVVFEWRNRDAEVLATSTAALMAQRTGARVVIAHASNPEIAAIARHHRSAGANLWVETCPQYFMLFEHEAIEFGPLRKFTPPARARTGADLEYMWRCLAAGEFDIVSSDHAPSTIEQKGESIWEAHFGLPGLDTTLSVLLDAAYRGLISYERVVEVYSERPAKLYGLHPRKGRLTAGADADIVLVDPQARWMVSNEEIVSKAGWSPYSGRELRGRAVATYSRGTLAASDGHVVAEPGSGRFLPGAGLSPQT